MKRVAAVLTALCLLTTVTACGDGGGGVSTEALSSAVVKMSVCTGEAISPFALLILGAALGLPQGALGELSLDVTCVNAAGTCPDVLTCLGMDPDSTCDPDAEPSETCSGSSVVECRSLDNGLHLTSTQSCHADIDGPQCFETQWGYAQCGAGTCAEEAESCDGSVVVDCDGEIEERTDCSIVGLSCVEVDGEAFCAQAGSSCTDDYCSGSTIVDCQDGYEGLPIDCSSIDPALTCVAEEGDVDCAVPSGQEECTTNQVVCEGSTARACLGGKWFDLECSAFLGAGCTTTTTGAVCVSDQWP